MFECKYCSEAKNVFVPINKPEEEDHGITAYINCQGTLMMRGVPMWDFVEINYCPMCGRPLRLPDNRAVINESFSAHKSFDTLII